VIDYSEKSSRGATIFQQLSPGMLIKMLIQEAFQSTSL